MARSDVPTKLSPDEWARLHGLDPLHFNGVNFDADPNQTAICARTWSQYEWQDADRVSREQVALAIREAEEQVEGMLGFRILPAWEYDELVIPPQPAQALRAGFVPSVNTGFGYFIAGGVEAVTLLDQDAAVTFSDEDGDGFDETATIVLTTGVTADPSEIEPHTPTDGGGFDERNAIRPFEIRAVDAGGGNTTFTITCKREQLVKWDRLTVRHPEPIDAGDATAFYNVIDIWRHYNDPSRQATLRWRQSACGCDGASGCPNCLYVEQEACLRVANEQYGRVTFLPAEWNSGTLQYDWRSPTVNSQPMGVRLFYRAGLRDQTRANTLGGQRARFYDPYRVMPRRWALAIAHLASAKLDRAVCDCGPAGDIISKYNEDLAYTGGAEQTATFTLSARDLNNPIGTRRGEVAAWHLIQAECLGQSA